ncbi:MAG TPA: PAS domain-containing protein, partial [Geothrix sp.]|nr:PAS domain-containing protein [Geothrix sp.]
MASSPNIADRAALIEALPVGALLADGSGRILAANGAACRLLGLSREGLLATGLFEPRWKVQARDGGRAP